MSFLQMTEREATDQYGVGGGPGVGVMFEGCCGAVGEEYPPPHATYPRASRRNITMVTSFFIPNSFLDVALRLSATSLTSDRRAIGLPPQPTRLHLKLRKGCKVLSPGGLIALKVC